MPSNHAELLARLGLAYPRQPVPRDTFDVYLADLCEVPPLVLAAAVKRLVRSSEWFPTIRAIREACAEIVLLLPSEAQALAQVEAGLRDPAALTEVHPLVHEAAKLAGGYREFRTSTEPAVVRGQFGKYFRQLRSDAVLFAQLSDAIALPRRPEMAA